MVICLREVFHQEHLLDRVSQDVCAQRESEALVFSENRNSLINALDVVSDEVDVYLTSLSLIDDELLVNLIVIVNLLTAEQQILHFLYHFELLS